MDLVPFIERTRKALTALAPHLERPLLLDCEIRRGFVVKVEVYTDGGTPIRDVRIAFDFCGECYQLPAAKLPLGAQSERIAEGLISIFNQACFMGFTGEAHAVVLACFEDLTTFLIASEASRPKAETPSRRIGPC